MVTDRLELRQAKALVEMKHLELEQAQLALREEHKKDLVKISRQDLFDMLKNNKLKRDPNSYDYGNAPVKITVLALCDYPEYRREYTSYVCLTKDGEDLIAGGYRWDSSDRFRGDDHVYIWSDHRRWR
jgi:hypothetical protein